MNIFLTGATSPIGKVLATALALDHHALHLHGRDAAKLREMSKVLSHGDSQITTYQADLTQPSEIEAMFAKAADKTDRLDLLINNAFGKLEKRIDELAVGESQQFFLTSISGTTEVVRAALPLLRKSPSPYIINIVADWGFPMHNIMTGPSAYIAAKYACHGLGAALQTELAPFGIRTTNLCPGVVATDVEYETPDDDFARNNGNTAIHPRVLADAVRFIIGARTAHIKSIVLSPNNPEYNGL